LHRRVTAEQYGSLLTPIVMSKLPSHICFQIVHNTNQEVWKIEDLIELITIEMEAREASEGNRVQRDPSNRLSSNNNPRPQNKSEEITILHSGQNEKFRIRYLYCGEHHYSASCQRVLDIASRKEIIRQKNRCFICL